MTKASKGSVPVLPKRQFTTQASVGGFYKELVEDGVLDVNHNNSQDHVNRLIERFTRDFYSEVASGDVDYKNPKELGGLKKYQDIVNNPLIGVMASKALRHIGMILNYRKKDLRESDYAYNARLAANAVKVSAERFKLMAEAVAMAALEKAAGGADGVDPNHIQILADMIVKAGSGPKDLFKDFRFALKSDIGNDETPVKMLHDLPEIVDIANSLIAGKPFRSLNLLNESNYIFGRKEIAREGVKLIVGNAVDASVDKLKEVASSYIESAAKELGADLAHNVDPSRARKIRDHLVDQMMSKVSIKAGGEKGKITVRELAERVAHPVGKGLLEAAISDQLLQRTQTLEKVKKGWFDWAKGKTQEQKVQKKEFKSKKMAEKALAEFLKFDPENATTFSAADELKARVNEDVSGRSKRYTEASEAVDVMVTENMRKLVASGKQGFFLHPLVRERLVQHLYDNKDIDQVAFCSAFCDKLWERGGNLDKTITLAHFQKKGDRTQGTWVNYFRKASQKFWKALGWPKSSTNADALMGVLKEVGDSVKSGVPTLRVYSSHRDAKYAVEQAIIEASGGPRPDEIVDDAVLNALTKQVTVVLEKARVDGKKMYLADIIDALQPGMIELGKRRVDPKTGRITEKTIGDLLLQGPVSKGYQKSKKATTETLASVCKKIVAAVDNGKDGLEVMGMTRKELVAKVLIGMNDNLSGHKEVRKSLEKALDSALKEYGQHTYTSSFIEDLVKEASKSIKVSEVTDKKGVVSKKLSFVDSGIKDFVEAHKGSLDIALANDEEGRKEDLLRAAIESRNTQDSGAVRASDGSEIIPEKRVPDQEVLPMLNSAKALFDFVLKNNATNSDYCIQVINDPKYAKVLHDSLFSIGDRDPKQLGEYLEENRLVGNTKVIEAIKGRQSELSACAEEFPGDDIKTLAEKLDIVKSAGFKVNGNDEDQEAAFEAIDRLIQGVSVPVYGVEKDGPVLLTGNLGPRNKCADLLRFIHSCGYDKIKIAQFIVDRDISQADKANCEVNGKPLVDYIDQNKGVDISIMPNAAEKKDIQANRDAQKALGEAKARAVAEAAKAAAEAARFAARKADMERAIVAGVSREMQAAAEAAKAKGGYLGALGRAMGWGGATVTTASSPPNTPPTSAGSGRVKGGKGPRGQ
jgi:uncharacterized UPF0160 family protein